MTIENIILFFLFGTAAGCLASRIVNRTNFEIARDAVNAMLHAGQGGWFTRSDLDGSQTRTSCFYEGSAQPAVLSIVHEELTEDMAQVSSQTERLSRHD